MVWELTEELARWPKFAEVDRRIDQQHGLDVIGVAAGLPADLLMPPDLRYLNGGQQVKLSLAGVAQCEGGSEMVDLFIASVALATQLEARATLAEPDPTLTAASVVEADSGVVLSDPNPDDQLRRLGLVLGAEPWGWSSYSQGDVSSGPPSWSFTLGRRVRKLRGVSDIDTYWSVVHSSPEPQVTEQVVAQVSPRRARWWTRAMNNPYVVQIVGGAGASATVAIVVWWVHSH